MPPGASNLYVEPEMTLTSLPVVGTSSVTEFPLAFATQTCLPSEETAKGRLNLYAAPKILFTIVPVFALSSVTAPAPGPPFNGVSLTTQTWVPSEAM